MAKKRCSSVDEVVGRNVRLLRLQRQMSQTELARQIGVTFQQVQKYENGRNRIGAGRLFKIADVLGVTVNALFTDAGQQTTGDGVPAPTALLAEPFALRLVQAFCQTPNKQVRLSLVALAEAIAARRQAASG